MTFNPGAQVDSIKSKYLNKVNRIHRGVFFEVAKRIIDRTPVKTGRARGNWQASQGKPVTGTVERDDLSGAAALAQVSAVVQGHTSGEDLCLTNNLVYIRPLEEGHSKQAPSGMVALTVSEFNGIVVSTAAAEGTA